MKRHLSSAVQISGFLLKYISLRCLVYVRMSSQFALLDIKMVVLGFRLY